MTFADRDRAASPGASSADGLRAAEADDGAPKLDAKTTKGHLLECARCHEPVVSSAWSGRVMLACGYCSFEDERFIDLEPSAVQVIRSVYRDRDRSGGGRKLQLDLGELLPSCPYDALTPERLRAEIATPVDGDDPAAAEWPRLWMAVWLATKHQIASDHLRARVALETTLAATRTPAYRAILIARLAQAAAAIGAPSLAKKWLRVCHESAIEEVQSEVRAARALIALAKNEPEQALDKTGDRVAGAGFKGNAVFVAIATNLEACERAGLRDRANGLLADLVRKKILMATLVPMTALRLGLRSLQRFNARARRRDALWSVVFTAMPIAVFALMRDLPAGSAFRAGTVASLAAGAMSWATFEWVARSRPMQIVWGVARGLIVVVCTAAGGYWLVR